NLDGESHPRGYSSKKSSRVGLRLIACLQTKITVILHFISLGQYKDSYNYFLQCSRTAESRQGIGIDVHDISLKLSEGVSRGSFETKVLHVPVHFTIGHHYGCGEAVFNQLEFASDRGKIEILAEGLDCFDVLILRKVQHTEILSEKLGVRRIESSAFL